jgi:hypothetical protein
LQNALDLALRDGRYDPSVLSAINNKTTLSQDKIDAMVDRYAQRSLNYRAITIARTETLRASNWGQLESWNQAAAQGLLNKNTVRRMWLTAEDERTCQICEPIPDMNPDGVALDEDFDTPDGAITIPPAHVSCRCTVVLDIP